MATSANAQIGSLTTLSFWDTDLTPDAWVAIANIRQFGEVGADKPEVDSTDLDSTGVERIGGLTDGKEISIVCVGNSTTLAQFEEFYNEGSTLDLKATFPTPLSTSRYFSLTPLGFSLGTITPSGLIEVTLRGRISGSISSVASH